MRGTRAVVMALGTAAALVAGLAPATASAKTQPAWHVVYRHRFPGPFSFFSSITPGGPGEVWAVAGFGAAGNGSGGAVLWRHHAWHVTALPHPGQLGGVEAASAVSRSDAWAVTANGYVIRWNGRSWRIAKRFGEPPGGPPGLLPTGVLAISPRDVWFFSGTFRDTSFDVRGLGTWHYDGRVWKRTIGAGKAIITASEASPANIWAVGGFRKNRNWLLRLGPKGWQTVTSPALAGLAFAAVLAERDGAVWAVARPATGTGPETLLHLSGGRWQSYALPANIAPGPPPVQNVIASDGRAGVWITAPAFYQHSGYLLHFRRGRWQEVALGVNVDALGITTVPGTNVLCAAGRADNSTGTTSTAVVWSTARSC